MARKPNFPPFVPGRIVHGKYRFILRPHRPRLVLGTVPEVDAATSPSPYESLSAFECVTVEQEAEGTTITITISQAEETASDEIEAFERVMSAVNAARFVDLEVSHDFDEHFEGGGRRYGHHAIFHRLRNPALRRLRIDGLSRGRYGFTPNEGEFMARPAFRGLQTLVITPSDGSQKSHLSLVWELLRDSRSLLAVCIGRCGGVRPGRACTCWDEWDPKEFNFNGMARVVKSGYSSFEGIWRAIAAHRGSTKRTQVAAMSFLALAESSRLPPEIWSMVGQYLVADGTMNASQFKRARELAPLATVAQRTLAMRGVATDQFAEALEEWLSAEGFSYGSEGGSGDVDELHCHNPSTDDDDDDAEYMEHGGDCGP